MDCNCTQEGHCPYYGRELWKKLWREAHNVDCTPEAHLRAKALLLAMPPLIVTEAKPEAPVATQSTGTTQQPEGKPCNCNKGQITAQQANDRRIANEQRRRDRMKRA